MCGGGVGWIIAQLPLSVCVCYYVTRVAWTGHSGMDRSAAGGGGAGHSGMDRSAAGGGGAGHSGMDRSAAGGGGAGHSGMDRSAAGGGPRVRGQPSPNLPGPRVRSFGGVCNVGAG